MYKPANDFVFLPFLTELVYLVLLLLADLLFFEVFVDGAFTDAGKFGETLKSIDRSIYGKSELDIVYKNFEQLEDVTSERYMKKVKEVKNGFKCGLSIKNFNDIKVGDVIEVFEIVEVKQRIST